MIGTRSDQGGKFPKRDKRVGLLHLFRLSFAVQVFKELASSSVGRGEGGTARGSGVRGAGAFAARIAVETAAGLLLWELYKSVTSK